MLQNSITIAQFNNYLLNIFNIFMNPAKDSMVCFSLNTMRKEIKNRNIDFSDLCSSENENENSQLTEKFNLKDELNIETIESLKKSSPFTGYFSSILENIETKINNYRNKNEKYEPNLFFNPNLYLLIKDQLYLVPLWTGILIDDLNKQSLFKFSDVLKTRLTNNPVENYFGMLKNRILLKRKVYPSELVSLSFLRVKSKYLEFYMKDSDLDKPAANFSAKYKENWSDKSTKKDRKKRILYEIDPIKEKGFFYKNKDVYNLIYEDLYEFDPALLEIESNEFKKVSFFIDKFVGKKDSEPQPMDIENISQHEKIKNNEFTIEFNIYKSFLEEISNIDYDFVKSKNFFKNNNELFIKLVKFLRSKVNVEIYNDQIIESYDPFKILIELFNLSDFVAISTKGDGNCFYRAVSFCIFGTDEYFYAIKIGSLFILIEYRDLFERIIENHHYQNSFETIFYKSKRND
ncbi:unnamed protein product, partial [Brachionus calyciflorus]